MSETLTILPVCSNSADIETISAIAKTLGLEILANTTVEQAEEQCRQVKPDMLLLDQDSLSLLNQIYIHSVLLTDKCSPAYIGEQSELGIKGFLFTPLIESQIKACLEQQTELVKGQIQQGLFQRQTLKLRELGELVGLISHEVASPLGNVNTAVSFLLESVEKIQASFDDKKLAATDLERFLKQADRALNMSIKNAGNAGNIISSFRSVATNQCDDEIKQFYLHRYIDEIVLSLKSKLKKLPHEIHVVVNESIDMNSNAGAFSQVINGLINKSITYGFDDNDPGQVIINARIDVEDGLDYIVLDFIDNGCGMNEEVLAELLNNDRPGNGTHLTTAMIKKVLEEKLAGTMTIESKEGTGAHYTLKMPRILA